jgi:deoxyhypusine synthase
MYFCGLTARPPTCRGLKADQNSPYEQKDPFSQFIEHHFRHFNAAALVDAAKGYETHLDEGGKMMITLAGAMSTGELGISLAEMIRQGKVDIISCTGANLEEDVMNLVAHSHYKRIPTTVTLHHNRNGNSWKLIITG